jgi:putative aldouronate transport system permease protein
MLKNNNKKGKKSFAHSKLGKEMYKARYIYLMLIPGLVFYFIFSYMPMYGLTLAFKDFRANLGILKSPFVGFYHYKYIFKDSEFIRALLNTLVISVQRIIIQFPAPIILAVFLNELRSIKLKRVLQTIYTLPHFLSWVIISGIMLNLLGNNGAVNNLLGVVGIEKQDFLINDHLFRPIIYFSDIWKTAGWTSIIYLASMASIDSSQYEAAYIDGATRFQTIIHITIPGIGSTISVLFLLSVGQVMNAGFEQIFNMYNAAVMDVADILDTYIYRITFEKPTDFGFSTAVSLFKSVINFLLLFVTDRIVKSRGHSGIFY